MATLINKYIANYLDYMSKMCDMFIAGMKIMHKRDILQYRATLVNTQRQERPLMTIKVPSSQKFKQFE